MRKISGGYTIHSHAKVNLYLGIRGIRQDGYHLLDMVNAKLSLNDTVRVTWSREPGVVLVCSEPGVPCDSTNTAYKAAQCFLEQVKSSHGVHIHLEKRIPHGAGLGGGSSNAAAVLRALNAMNGNCLSMDTLQSIGLGIGADVPFFLYDGICYVGGIGEKVVPLGHPPQPDLLHVVLCSPPQHVETRGAYGLWDRSDRRPPKPVGRILSSLANGEYDKAIGAMYNSFEAVIFPQYRVVEDTYNTFRGISPTEPRMSGSGSNCFSVHTSQEEARTVQDALVDQGLLAHLCTLVP